jgi:hypothetical protein
MKDWRSAVAGIAGIVMLAAPTIARADSLDGCQQAQAAARSGFRTVPPRTRAFNARYGSTQADSSALALARQMKPLATPAELVAIKRLGHLQSRIDRLLESFVFKVFGQLTQALTGVSIPGA